MSFMQLHSIKLAIKETRWPQRRLHHRPQSSQRPTHRAHQPRPQLPQLV